MAYGWPCNPNTEVTQFFGTNINTVQPDGHTGMDFGLSEGSPIYAIGDGIVRVADWSDTLPIANVYGLATTAWLGRSAGIVVVIDHGDIVSISAHLSATDLNAGDKVVRGQIIGKSGSTGYSFGAHLHFEILPDGWDWRTQRWYGRVDPLKYISKAPVTPSLSSLQRIAVEGANYRPEPNTNKEPTQTFHAGDVLNFVGFVHGSTPTGGNSDIWLKGIGGGYVHVSAVVGGSEKGLPNLSPPKPAPVVTNPAERTVGAKGANQRSGPSTSAPITTPLEAGFTFVAKGWVKGDAPKDETNRIWFVGNNSGGYVWSGACTDSSIGSLPDLSKTVEVPVTPSKPVTPTPVPPVISKPSPNPVEPPVVIPTLLAEFPAVDEVFPAHPDNYQLGNMPANPTHVAIHEFGGFNIPQSSVKTYFATSLADRQKSNPNAGPTSAEFSVGEDGNCCQHVSIHDRAFHAGKNGNGYRSVETHSKQTPAVIAKTRQLIREMNDALGYELIPILHKDIPGNATQCGTNIDLDNYKNIGLTPKATDKPTKEELLKVAEELRSLIERY